MRSKPCWTESLILEIASVYLTVAVVVIVLLLLVTCTEQEAHAETGVYLDLGAGLSMLRRDAPDGVWVQNGLPHKTDMLDPAFRVGVGYAFNSRWAVEAHWVRLGQARLSADTVDDRFYDVQTKQCTSPPHCAAPYRVEAHDTMQGGQLSVTRTFDIGPVKPFLRAGAGVLYHHLQVRTPATPTVSNFDLFGWIPTGVVGVGVAYHAVSVEADYYQSLGGNCLDRCGWPFASHALVVLASIKIPLS